MEVPITQFRQKIFSFIEQSLEGKDVRITYKGRRVRIVPEGKPVDKLSRITPLDLIPEGVDLNDESWVGDIMREWEQNWDRELASIANPAPTRVTPKKTIRRRSRTKA
jgi:hypothetical protein